MADETKPAAHAVSVPAEPSALDVCPPIIAPSLPHDDQIPAEQLDPTGKQELQSFLGSV